MEIAQHDWVWLILRIIMAWMFLIPVPGLIRDWESTKVLTRLISGIFVNTCSVISIAMMVLGAASVLLGLYAQIGGILLLAYSLIGVRAHFKLAKLIASIRLPKVCHPDGDHAFAEVKSLGIVGQITSGQKNMVLAATALAFTILGSGPVSITGNLW
jgi:hypothetical protein